MNLLLPRALVRRINKLLKEKGVDAKELQPVIPQGTNSDLKILVHLGEKGFDSVGHVDIEIDGIVLSYGCHDHHNTSLFGALGPGVVHIDEKVSYLHFITKIKDKTIVEFGVHLTDEEKKKVKSTIMEMANRFEPWLSDQELYEKGLPYQGDRKNYASLLTYYTRSKFYKFKEGKYRTYFVLSTNCVLLADTIVGKSGIDLVSFNGIVTPGSYYEFLNSEFLLPNSKVVSKCIHTKEIVDTYPTNNSLRDEIYTITDPVEYLNNHIFKEIDYE